MKIDRKLAIQIFEYLDKHKKFYFPFRIMCGEYTLEDDDFVEIEPNKWRIILEDESYQTFELWENLQDLDEETIKLMSKGFIEKITNSKGIVRNFIFYTKEGFTFQPNPESDMSDVENCQILGWGKGRTSTEAFDDFKKESLWLKNLRFKKVTGVELKDEKTYSFDLK